MTSTIKDVWGAKFMRTKTKAAEAALERRVNEIFQLQGRVSVRVDGIEVFRLTDIRNLKIRGDLAECLAANQNARAFVLNRETVQFEPVDEQEAVSLVTSTPTPTPTSAPTPAPNAATTPAGEEELTSAALVQHDRERLGEAASMVTVQAAPMPDTQQYGEPVESEAEAAEIVPPNPIEFADLCSWPCGRPR